MMWPYFAEKVHALIEAALKDGLSVGLHSGYRSGEEQDALYAKGRTVKNLDGVSRDKPMGNTVTNGKAGSSWHNWGLAADVVFKRPDGGWTWAPEFPQDTLKTWVRQYRIVLPDNVTTLPFTVAWAKLGFLGKDLGLDWGGDWTKFKDYPHFQLTGGMTITQAQEIGRPEEIWREVAKRLSRAP